MRALRYSKRGKDKPKPCPHQRLALLERMCKKAQLIMASCQEGAAWLRGENEIDGRPAWDCTTEDSIDGFNTMEDDADEIRKFFQEQVEKEYEKLEK
jgi:hypothetical protein